MFRKSEPPNSLTVALEARRAKKLPICDLTITNPTIANLLNRDFVKAHRDARVGS